MSYTATNILSVVRDRHQYLKKFLIIFLILVLLPTQFSLATKTQYNEAKDILQKLWEGLKEINDWGTGWFDKLTTSSWTGKYVSEIRGNVEQGLAEERQEYQQDLFKILGVAWEKIKNFVFHK